MQCLQSLLERSIRTFSRDPCTLEKPPLPKWIPHRNYDRQRVGRPVSHHSTDLKVVHTESQGSGGVMVWVGIWHGRWKQLQIIQGNNNAVWYQDEIFPCSSSVLISTCKRWLYPLPTGKLSTLTPISTLNVSKNALKVSALGCLYRFPVLFGYNF